MENIISCEYNIDNGCVEVRYKDGNLLRLNCEEVEEQLRTTLHSMAKVQRLLDIEPITYVTLAMSGEMQAYCDRADKMVKEEHDTMLQGYLENGYDKEMAEAMVREFYRYDS